MVLIQKNSTLHSNQFGFYTLHNTSQRLVYGLKFNNAPFLTEAFGQLDGSSLAVNKLSV
jgi:hypothetical protein